MRKLAGGVAIQEDELEEDSEKFAFTWINCNATTLMYNGSFLVGRLPNFAMKAGIEITEPLVEGSLGTTIYDLGRGAENAGASPILPANQHCRAGRRWAHRQCSVRISPVSRARQGDRV